MNEEVADQALVVRAQEGDSRAFELLVRKYQNRIVQLVSRFVGDADSHDVAQETFIRAWRAIKGFQGNAQFYTWLYRIGVNTAKNHLVSRNRHSGDDEIDIADAELFGHTEHLSDIHTPEADLLSGEIRDTVVRAINSLPAELRRAITLRELDGLSYEEIAEAMGCPIGTVRSRIFRAREVIDGMLKPLLT